MVHTGTYWYVLGCNDLFVQLGYALMLDLQFFPARSSVFESHASTSTFSSSQAPHHPQGCLSSVGGGRQIWGGGRQWRWASAASSAVATGEGGGSSSPSLCPSLASPDDEDGTGTGTCAVLASNLLIKGLATGQPPIPAFLRMLI